MQRFMESLTLHRLTRNSKPTKPVKPVCGLTHCYVDAHTGALGGKNEKKYCNCFIISFYNFMYF